MPAYEGEAVELVDVAAAVVEVEVDVEVDVDVGVEEMPAEALGVVDARGTYGGGVT